MMLMSVQNRPERIICTERRRNRRKTTFAIFINSKCLAKTAIVRLDIRIVQRLYVRITIKLKMEHPMERTKHVQIEMLKNVDTIPN